VKPRRTLIFLTCAFLLLLTFSSHAGDHQEFLFVANPFSLQNQAVPAGNSENFVDQLSDLHTPSDLGTHDVFADLQDYGLNYNAMTEADTGSAATNYEDFVDQQSNLHDPTDVGMHSNFGEMQDQDDTYNTLTEVDSGSGSIEVWTSPTSHNDPANNWSSETFAYDDDTGTGAYAGLAGGGGRTSEYLELNLTSAVTSTKVQYYIRSQTQLSGLDIDVYDTSWTNVFSGTPTTDAWTNVTFTSQTVLAVRIRVTKGGGGPGDYYFDELDVLEVTPVTSYDLDLEVGWTAAQYSETNEELCIYGGTQGSEALRVDVWSGAWVNLILDLASGWNNISISSYLTSSTFTIRFTDLSDDAVEADTWQVDAVLLHCWTPATTNHELDLEVGWTSVDYDEANEYLCIYPVTGSGWPTEDIIVDVWNGAWVTVLADLTPDTWNNISISSYLTGSTFEIRFLGGTETSDTTQSTWELDAVLIHTWTPSYAPTNKQGPTLDNADDTDNMYAQYKEYQLTVYASDQNGFSDIDYLEIGLWNDTQSTEYCRFRYDEDTNTFTEEYDGDTYVSLNTGSSTAIESGNDINATFYFTVDWDFPDVSELDANCTVIDAQSELATTWYEVNWDVETRLEYSFAPSINDGSGTADRGDLDGSFSLTGTVIYRNSVDDYPSSTAVDVWVNATEYGSTSGPWSDIDLTSGAFEVTCYADDVIGLDIYFIKIVEEGTGATGADLYYTTTVNDTYIADRVQVQLYSVVDDRVDVGTSVNVDFTLYYDYDDSPVTDGTITLNTIPATDQGSGVWRVTDSEVAVIANTYDTIVYSGGTHGLTIVDQNGLSQEVIWDQIVVQTTVADDTRVNVGANVEIQVTLWLAYDSTFLGSGDTVTLAGQVMTWDGGNSWFELTVSQASVGLWTYFVNSTSDATYGITSIDTNSQSVDVIWDQIVVQTTLADDTRVNIGNNVEIQVTLWLAYDSTFLESGDTVTLNGQAMTWDSGNSWFNLTVFQASIGLWTYFVNSSTETNFDITVIDTNSQSVGVVWDQIVVQTTVADDTRVNIGDNVEIRVTLWLAYDSTYLGAGNTITLAGQAMTWDSGSSWFDLTVSQASVGLWIYYVNSSSDATYGITTLDMNSQSVDVIWDRIDVQTTVADDTRLNVGDNAEVRVTLWLAYDSTLLGSGDTVTLAGQAMTWDAGNTWFDLTVSQASVGLWTYFVNSSVETNFGITALDTNSQTVDIIWDQIVVQSTVADDTRVNIGDNVEIRVTLWFAYDNTFLGSGDTATLAGQAMTWDSGNSWFDLTVSQASVGLWTYFVNSSSDAVNGITLLDTNGQNVGVVWDQIVVQTTVADDTRVNVGANMEIRVTLWLDYDDTFLGSGDSVTLGGLAMTWDAGNSWFDLTVSQASMGFWSYFVNSTSETTYGITDFILNSQSVDVIWDQIVVQTTVADDTRVNVGANVEVRVTLWLAYDSTFLGSGDTVTLAGQAMTWDAGNTWFDLTVSQASVGLWTYFANSSSDATYGITLLDTNSQSVDVVWDQIVVQTTVADDTRVNVGANVEIRVTLWLDYDDTFLDSGDSVTLGGLAMTWDGVNSWFDLTVSQASVGLWTYFVNSSSDATYGITTLDLAGVDVDVIWDQVLVQGYSVSDTRVNLDDSVNIDVTLVYSYDTNAVTDGTVTINGLSATHQSGGVWRASDSQSTVQLVTYNTVVASSITHGISSVDQNSQTQDVIWDRLVVVIGVDDASPFNGVQANFTLTVTYDYDDATCTTYQLVIDRNSTWWHSFTNTNKTLFVDTNTDTTYNYSVRLINSESTYDITSFATNTQQVVWAPVPNVAPTNDAGPVLTNPDDTDNMYARFRYYIITSTVTDTNGYSDIDYVDLSFYDDAQTGAVWTVRYTVAGDSFSVQLGGAYIDLHATSYATPAGNSITITWFIKIDWDHIDLTDIDTRQYVDDGALTDDDYYESNWDVETRLSVTGLSVDDGSGTADRGDLDGSFTLSGTLIFYGSIDDNPLSNETDVWVIASEYGTNVGPWSDTTLTAGQFSLTVYADDTVGLDTYTVRAVAEGAGAGGTDLLQSTTQDTYIADRIQVQSYSVVDDRVNVDATVNIDVTLYYEYDSSQVTDGSVTVNGLSATHEGLGVWRISDVENTVMANTYNTVTYSVGTHGLAEVNQNGQSQTVIWDQIIVQTTVADDTRVDIGNNVEIQVTLWLAYDSTFLGVGDTVTLAGQVMTWDGGNSWFELTASQASVGLWTYFVNSSSDATYGITNLDTNSQTVDVIWDQIVVQTTVADDTRINVGANVEIQVTLWLAYDSTFLGVGDTVTLAGQVMTWDGGNSWFELTVSQASVGLWTYFVNSSSDASYGITNLDTNSQTVDVIWDQIVVQTTVANENRVNIGANVEIQVTLWLAYDSISLGSGDTVTLNGQAMAWDNGNSWFDITVSQVSVGLWTYFVNSSAETNFGITALDTNSQTADVIWDQVVVQTSMADDTRVNIGDNVEIRVTLWLAYDDTYLGAGDTVTLDGTAMTWDGVNSWFDLSVSQASVGLWTYFVNASTETNFGITALDTNSQSVEVIWDQIVVQTTVADDTRVNVGANVEIRVTLWLAYDSTPLGATDSVTLDGTAMTWDVGNSWFDLTVSQASVSLWTYFVNSSSDATYGITNLKQ